MDEMAADEPRNTIHLGEETAVVVPLDEYLRLREAQIEVEGLTALRELHDRKASGTNPPGMTTEQVREMLGLDRT
ncbi:hypothetical protein F8568_003735 [Actinomadura sp. LD22]|uniref:Type II toxin-antitoxin system Phd/YefM family antitoxin n=1 Tax=Actinomadura physcomitrii TaxID=2650748 RepID=A0A6I4M2A8_9ACTN|nr:hypothetical protein [Actinomadura physcomitrii]MVZ99501.1 hypothetical protein [Actinomadura physcomitrii]